MIKNKDFDNLRKTTAQKYIVACFLGGFFGLPFFFRNRKLFYFFIVCLFIPGLNVFLAGFFFFIFAIEGIGRVASYMTGRFDYKIFKFIDEEEEKTLEKENIELENFQKLSKKEQLKWNLDKGILSKEKYERILGLVLINEMKENLDLKLLNKKDLEILIGEFQKEMINKTEDKEEFEKSNIIDKIRLLFLNNLLTLEELQTLNK